MGITIRHIWNRWRVRICGIQGKGEKTGLLIGWVTVNRSSYSQRGEDADYERYTVSPRLTLFYALPGESSIRLKSTMGNVTPSLGELSAIDQVIDSLQIQRVILT